MIQPLTSTEPSGWASMPTVSTSFSSVISPTISSRMSSSVTRPIEGAVLVDHEGEVRAALAERQQLVEQRRGVGDEPGRRRQRGDVEPGELAEVAAHPRQQVLGVQHADDAVGIAAPDRQAGVGAAHDLVEDLLRRRVGVDADDVLAVGHDLADLDAGEVEDAAQHVALLLADHAVLARQVDQVAQLLAGEHVVMADLGDLEQRSGSRARPS